MLINVSELRKGDNVMYASGRKFRRVKILKTPEKRGSFVSEWNAYKSVLCSERVEQMTKKYNWGDYKWKEHLFAPPEEHNCKVYINFNMKDIWLLNREEYF